MNIYINSPKRKKLSPETLRKISEKMKGRVPWIKGKKMSLETRRKQSESRKRYYQEHPEAKEQLRQHNLGKKQSAETIEKRVSHFRGKKRPEWVRNKLIATARRGADNHFWKGGISAISYRLRRHGRHTEWRNEVFKRDSYTCQLCGQRGGELHPHHIVTFSDLLDRLYKRYGRKNLFEKAVKSRILWDVKNGQTLCRLCHSKTDSYAKNTFHKIPS